MRLEAFALGALQMSLLLFIHMEILKTGVLHKEICVQSLWETVKCRDKGKNKKNAP